MVWSEHNFSWWQSHCQQKILSERGDKGYIWSPPECAFGVFHSTLSDSNSPLGLDFIPCPCCASQSVCKHMQDLFDDFLASPWISPSCIRKLASWGSLNLVTAYLAMTYLVAMGITYIYSAILDCLFSDSTLKTRPLGMWLHNTQIDALIPASICLFFFKLDVLV